MPLRTKPHLVTRSIPGIPISGLRGRTTASRDASTPITANGLVGTSLTTLFQSQGAAPRSCAERLLAGLMDVVPEFAKPGEPQILSATQRAPS